MHDWSLADAATYMQEFLLTQGGWRFCIGRDRANLLHEVSGISLTWKTVAKDKGLTPVWRFVFALRRDEKWYKATVNVEPNATDEDGLPTVQQQLQDAAFELMHGVVNKAFPE